MMFRSIPNDCGKAKSSLILLTQLFLFRSWLFTKAKLRLELEILKFLLCIFSHFGFSSGPFMCNLNLLNILSLFSYNILISSQITQFHISLLFFFSSFIKHISLFIFLLVIFVYSDRINIHRIFWLQFIWNLLWSFILFRLLGLFSDTHVHSRLLRSCLLSTLYFLTFSLPLRHNSFLNRYWSLLILRFLLRLLLFWFFVFRRARIKHSWRSNLIFLISKSRYIYSFSFELKKSFRRCIKFWV